MGERQDTLQQYVSDMLALEQHILEAVERQTDDSKVDNHPEANQLLGQLERTLKDHTASLEQLLSALGGDAASPVKEAVSSVAGVAAGLYDKVRGDKVSKMLRDDYTALNLASISYTMLHSTGMALKNQTVADLALRHLEDLTPVVVNISEIIPLVVARELSDAGMTTDTAVGQRSADQTHRAWRSQQTQ